MARWEGRALTPYTSMDELSSVELLQHFYRQLQLVVWSGLLSRYESVLRRVAGAISHIIFTKYGVPTYLPTVPILLKIPYSPILRIESTIPVVSAPDPHRGIPALLSAGSV